MNAIESNEYTQNWKSIIKNVKKPDCILIISAHWQTNGTKITAAQNLTTIHDFGGFPDNLNNKIYPAKGDPELAKKIAKQLDIELDFDRGLDHGAWSVLAQIYPECNIPVLQLSLDYNKTTIEHFEFAKKIAHLSNENVLILGTGNIVHNLSLIDWSGQNNNSWALEFDQKVIQDLKNNNFESIVNYNNYGESAKKAVPSEEHFLPLIYICAIAKQNKLSNTAIFNDKIEMGSISMTSVVFS